MSIIVLTAVENKREVFNLEGINDYVVKPYSVSELMARVRTQLRRVRPAPEFGARIRGIGVRFSNT